MNSNSYAMQPCPFCGSSRSYEDFVPNTGFTRRFICCQDCHAQGPWSTIQSGPQEWWNKRANGTSEPAQDGAAVYHHETGKCTGPCDCRIGQTCRAYLIFKSRDATPRSD